MKATPIANPIGIPIRIPTSFDVDVDDGAPTTDGWAVTTTVPTVITTPLAAAAVVNDVAKPFSEVSVKNVESVLVVVGDAELVGMITSKVTERSRLTNENRIKF